MYYLLCLFILVKLNEFVYVFIYEYNIDTFRYCMYVYSSNIDLYFRVISVNVRFDML